MNISPSRLRRKSDPDSMVWETLPVIHPARDVDQAGEAIWPYLPSWSRGGLPVTRGGKLLSTANARLRPGEPPFAPTFMQPWTRGGRFLVIVSWFYEFDRRVRPQIPYAVFSLERAFWVMAGLGGVSRRADGTARRSVAIITVEPNRVLQSVGHHRSPALLRSDAECRTWLHGTPAEALRLLRPYPDEAMGVEPMPMNIKIPGNQAVQLPAPLLRRNPGRP